MKKDLTETNNITDESCVYIRYLTVQNITHFPQQQFKIKQKHITNEKL